MLQHPPIPSVPAAVPDYLSFLLHESVAEAAMIAFADPGPDSRIVVSGSNTLELQCALLQRGCTSVFAIRHGNWPLTDTIDVVLLTAIDRQDELEHAVAQAHRVLAPLGTLALRLSDHAGGPLLRLTRRLLLLHGFEWIRSRAVAGDTLYRAELPLHGRLACA